MIHHPCAQNSEEWHRLRLGIPTASEFSKIITPKTRKLSKQADHYLYCLLAERIVGPPLDSPETQWMQRGTELEPQAAKSYEFERDCEVQECGLFTTDDGAIGASPDRLVGTDGLLEIKCPSPGVHIEYMMTQAVDQEYLVQLQGQLLVTERAWVDIQSYCPGLPTVIVRVTRDEPFIADLRIALLEFVARLAAVYADLQSRFGPFKRAERPTPQQPHPGLDMTAEDWARMMPWKGDGANVTSA